ncbi:MAG: nodulation protein NfeD, partial [Verrucomicrobiota bacterium]
MIGRIRFVVPLLLLLAPSAAGAAPPGPPGAPVLVATIAAPISPVTADYLAAVIEQAEEARATLVVVELDTPGGLD